MNPVMEFTTTAVRLITPTLMPMFHDKRHEPYSGIARRRITICRLMVAC